MLPSDDQTYFSICFTSHPDIFISDLDRLKLVWTRQENPDIKLNLVASRKNLTEAAWAQLIAFCKSQDISLHDFDDDVYAWVEHQHSKHEKTIYEFASNELEPEFGDTKAAVALTQSLISVHNQLGACMQASSLGFDNQNILSNRDNINPAKPSSYAIEILSKIQEELVYNYQRKIIDLIQLDPYFTCFGMYHLTKPMAHESVNVFDFRQKISADSSFSPEVKRALFDKINQYLFKFSDALKELSYQKNDNRELQPQDAEKAARTIQASWRQYQKSKATQQEPKARRIKKIAQDAQEVAHILEGQSELLEAPQMTTRRRFKSTQ